MVRRNLFGTSSGVNDLPQRTTSLTEALHFDLQDHVGTPDSYLSEDRAGDWVMIPIVMLALTVTVVPLLAWAILAVGSSVSLTLIVPIAAILVIDAAASVLMWIRGRFDVPAHRIARILCVYLAVNGILWVATASATLSLAPANASFVAIVLGLMVLARCLTSAATPAFLSINMAIAIASSLMVADGQVTFAVFAASTLICVYAVWSSRRAIRSDRLRLQHERQASKAAKFVSEFENSGRGWFWETDSLGTLTYVSLQLARQLEQPASSLLGKKITDLFGVDDADVALEGGRTLGYYLSARFPFSDVLVTPAAKNDRTWSLSGNSIFDERGRFQGFCGIGSDLSEQLASEREISRLAQYDSLTALPNRAMMRQTLEEALRNAARRQRGCSLFMIDLDRFKNVNDTLGHPAGDALLQQVAQRLSSAMGNHGQIGRLGGDEFQAVLPGVVDVGLLESLARTLIEQVSRPYVIEGHKVIIGASIGIAIGDPGRATPDAMVRNADLALYAAKAAGRGKHSLYQPSMHEEAAERQNLENDLRQALDRNELAVFYQPVVRTATEEVTAFEALVRWRHPTRGFVSPAEFIGIAEEAGLIGQIGDWVLRSALEDAAKWPDKVRVAVNLSPIQFKDPQLTTAITRHLHETGVRAERLELEITEGVFLEEGTATDETFACLKDLGVRLALDDFGTGYSSLGYLKKAPFNKIKIDQSFVRGAASSVNRNAAIVRAIVNLAESLGMDTCAEGVETHDDLQLIRELGVSMVQGYIFGKPADRDATLLVANRVMLEADGFARTRENRQRLMRRALTMLDGKIMEVRLRNISTMGALVECEVNVAPGTCLSIDLIGAGRVDATVRWSQAGKFGVQFANAFDLGLLAPKKPRGPTTNAVRLHQSEKKVVTR